MMKAKKAAIVILVLISLWGIALAKAPSSQANSNSIERNFPVTIGDGDENARIPYDFYWMSNLYETLYYSDEIGTEGYIEGVTFYYSYDQTTGPLPSKLWIGETDLTDLSQNWIPSTGLSQVYDGSVVLPSNETELYLAFSQPYYYTGRNLVLLAWHHHDYYCVYNVLFSAQTRTQNRARRFSSDMTNPNPEAPQIAGTLTAQFPKTTLWMENSNIQMGGINGVILNADNQPVPDAEIMVEYTGYQALTGTAGTFTFEQVPSGNHTLKVRKHGYQTLTAEITIITDQVTSVTLTLPGLPVLNVSGRITGSDHPEIGLAGAVVNLTGYDNHSATTDANGIFAFNHVYGLNAYQYTVTCVGYVGRYGSVTLSEADLDMGTLVLTEFCYPAAQVEADVAIDNTGVLVSWNPPAVLGGINESETGGTRDLTGYRIWRLNENQQGSESNWVLLGFCPVGDNDFFDTNWYSIPNASYKWAVKAVYSNNAVSSAVFSPVVVKNFQFGTLTGRIVDQNNANINVATLQIGPYSFNSMPWAVGVEFNYSASLPEGVYTVRVFSNSYQMAEVPNVQITPGQIHILHIGMNPVENQDEVNPVINTQLLGNYPNPFYPETVIRYAAKGQMEAELTVYDAKGRKIISFSENCITGGYYERKWDGRDSNGTRVQDGIYFYRLKSRDFCQSGKMVLLRY